MDLLYSGHSADASRVTMARRLTALTLAALISSCASTLRTTADDLLAGYRAPDSPGGAVMVIDRGRVVYTEAVGLADVEAGTPITLETNFRLASLTKQFTAMAIMILAERKAVSLDQPITDFFPDFAPVGRLITLKHLLTHTSGLVAYEDVMPETTSTPLLDADVLRLVRNIDSTYFTPGSAFRYSNTGYALLALVVERASHTTFARFLKDEIFDPLDMAGTVAYERAVSEVSHRAYGYSPDSTRQGKFQRTDQSMTSSVLGDGGIYSSLDDLRRWDEALRSGRLVSRETYREALTPHATVEEGVLWYGYGWYVEKFRGFPAHSHGGSTVGFRNHMLRIPERNLTVIALFNRADARPEEAARRLAEEYLDTLGQ